MWKSQAGPQAFTITNLALCEERSPCFFLNSVSPTWSTVPNLFGMPSNITCINCLNMTLKSIVFPVHQVQAPEYWKVQWRLQIVKFLIKPNTLSKCKTLWYFCHASVTTSLWSSPPLDSQDAGTLVYSFPKGLFSHTFLQPPVWAPDFSHTILHTELPPLATTTHPDTPAHHHHQWNNLSSPRSHWWVASASCHHQ